MRSFDAADSAVCNPQFAKYRGFGDVRWPDHVPREARDTKRRTTHDRIGLAELLSICALQMKRTRETRYLHRKPGRSLETQAYAALRGREGSASLTSKHMPENIQANISNNKQLHKTI